VNIPPRTTSRDRSSVYRTARRDERREGIGSRQPSLEVRPHTDFSTHTRVPPKPIHGSTSTRRATEKDTPPPVGRPTARRATTTTTIDARRARAVDSDPCARASEGRAREGRCETGGRDASASKKNRAFARVDEGVGVSENVRPGVSAIASDG